MVGGTVAHSAIQSNLIVELGLALRGKPCRVFGSHLKLAVSGRIRYPDAFVVCTPQPANAIVAAEAVVVFEILSPGTAHSDLFVKNAEYRATPSIQRFVLLDQSTPSALVFARRGLEWLSETLNGTDALLRMPEIDVQLRLADIYAGIAAGPQEDDAVVSAPGGDGQTPETQPAEQASSPARGLPPPG